MKFCKNCNHLRIPQHMDNFENFWKCNKVSLETSFVSGKQLLAFCTQERSQWGTCGFTGILFETKQGD